MACSDLTQIPQPKSAQRWNRTGWSASWVLQMVTKCYQCRGHLVLVPCLFATACGCSENHFFLKIEWFISSSFYSMQSWLCRGCTVRYYVIPQFWIILGKLMQSIAKPESLPPIIIRFPPPRYPRLYTVVDMPGISMLDHAWWHLQWVPVNLPKLPKSPKIPPQSLPSPAKRTLEPLNHTRQSATSTCAQRHRGL